jgi:hypothetical protein
MKMLLVGGGEIQGNILETMYETYDVIGVCNRGILDLNKNKLEEHNPYIIWYSGLTDYLMRRWDIRPYIERANTIIHTSGRTYIPHYYSSSPNTYSVSPEEYEEIVKIVETDMDIEEWELSGRTTRRIKPTTGLVGMLLSIKHYGNIDVVGFDGYLTRERHTKQILIVDCHRVDRERGIFSTLSSLGYITYV